MPATNLTLGEAITKTTAFFREKGLENPRLEADLILAHVLDLSRVKLYTDWERPLETAELEASRDLISRRLQGWPLAYLTGRRSFLSWEFFVNEAVLIPRPETELLVEAVYNRLKACPVINGIDIGTGSGVIAISLAKLLPESRWQAVDFSAAALAVAAQNAEALGVAERIQFRQGDLLGPCREDGVLFDVIVSNPPYVPDSVIATLQPEVQREPRMALAGGPDGLDIYRRLLPGARSLLKPGGIIALEHGDDQRPALLEIAAGIGLACETLDDLAGKDRVLICRRLKDNA
jgi:release factor glutamine methyltransferase